MPTTVGHGVVENTIYRKLEISDQCAFINIHMNITELQFKALEKDLKEACKHLINKIDKYDMSVNDIKDELTVFDMEMMRMLKFGVSRKRKKKTYSNALGT